ncbi:hypothetical protein HJ588_17025 [Flexivirga sp. ID2601S]|uniref:Mycothiol-dependent maleylpyruvate isomerase metal-binding domain-containing protein n=1 Tax=Flexivirga aerilata TaxID=1656889 RepID=A0A849AJF4_9MICO|nr:hypothetical protein [Flexivirga aerilata]
MSTDPLTIPLEEARTACVDSIESFLAAADAVPELDLLDASRCRGWSRLDVLTHVVGGGQQMLTGLIDRVDDAPTVDAASYWPTFRARYGDDDPIAVLMAQRRRADAYGRPDSARRQLRDVAAPLLRGVSALPDGQYRWGSEVFAAGDYLAVWAVENVVHQLDLATDAPLPASALELGRRTVDALLATPFPTEWTDEQAVLVGTGRVPVPEGLPSYGAEVPVLG